MWLAPLVLDVLGRIVIGQLGHLAPAPSATQPPPPPAGQVDPPPKLTNDLTSWAGDARITSLPELLQASVQHAPTLASAKLDIAIAEARIDQTYARDDWHLAAQLQAGRTTGFVSGIAFSRNTQVDLSSDLSRTFSTGGTLTFHFQTDYTKSASDQLGDQQTWYDAISASYTQPLLRNRGRFLYEANQRRAELARDVSVLARRSAAINTVQTVVSAYWDLVLAERQVSIAEASLALAGERLRVTQIGVNGGKIPRSEVPAVQQIIATREEDLLNAQLAVIDRSLTLRRTVGLPIGANELSLRVEAELGIEDTTWDLGPLVERAYTASPELAELAQQDASATIDVEVTQNGLLPRLDAALTVGPTGQAKDFADAWESVGKLEAMTYIGSLSLEHDLGNRQVKGLLREDRATQAKLAVSALDVRAQVAQTMALAVSQLELAKRRIELSQQAIALANENIQLESDRFSLGKSTNFDVLNRQEDLRQAELRQAQAMVDWHKAESTVQALTGDLLPTYGITLE